MGESSLKYIILSEKSWNRDLLSRLSDKIAAEWILIDQRENFNLEILDSISPDYIFIPHWSYIIPEEIFSKYICIVFHMTDLPYGRGGSPLQNLIVRGFTETKISALKVVKELDAGDIYLKKDLSLAGTAQEIFKRADKIIEIMIAEIIELNIKPAPQVGEPYCFIRRKPEQSNIGDLEDPEKLYDYVRMLDADGYPNAFVDTEHFKFEFTNASLNSDKSITANVRITKK